MARKHEMSSNTENQSGIDATFSHQIIGMKCAVIDRRPPPDMKMKRKKMSGLRRAIQAIFKPKDKTADSPDINISNPAIPSRLEKEVNEDVATVTEANEESYSSSQCSSASTKSLETGSSQSAPAISTLSPPEKNLTPHARASRPTKTPSEGKSKKSGFYMYNGHPSYLGSRLYQCRDVKPGLDILGRWVELGCGETGTTRLVHIPSENGKLVAAKIIQGEDPEVRFHKELDALHIVNGHPSFPHLVGVIQQSPLRCILEEFVGNDFIPENTTLEDVLKDKKIVASEIPYSDWVQIAQDIADGIKHLHQLEYLHINLKPENILLYATDGNWKGWRAKICDLGDCTFMRLAPKIHSTPEIQAAAESAAKPFVAPEVLRGETPYTVASDIYALGRVLSAIGKKTKITLLQHIGKKCSRKTAVKRPDIDKVYNMLERPSTPK
ncbi:probable LIM domain-containing serine/threonine-protein kinase DDB_G0287001 isoform X2 [Acanthaster planci]|nr:probable LIM domain-containing serine/threonine-protein kinase DDB_G0287001 isoform X2 [Acanthaster planci]